jgi:5-methylcytosine-specific restriction enzyme subunit McrC
MTIPIENIYFLLCYAWNNLDEKDRLKVSVDGITELVDLFAKILINVVKILLKRGIDKYYLDHTDECLGIKGKIDAAQTLKRNLKFKQKTICIYDEFSENILINQILISTINKLTRTRRLDKCLRADLIALMRMMPRVDSVELNASVFKRIRWYRNNSFYSFLMHICRLIYESILPSEKQGVFEFVDFIRDDHKMSRLFEDFVRNFYRIEQTKYYKVGRETIRWQFSSGSPEDNEYLPRMETDITLENESEKIIIDTKFYRETMSAHFDRERIKSINLYQLFSYLVNQEDDTEKTRTAKGILLYPAVDKDYELFYVYNNHEVQIWTVNLNTAWKEISARLQKVINTSFPSPSLGQHIRGFNSER